MSPTILTRRRFLKQTGGLATSSAFATALAMHKWAAAAPLTDYKALVCVFLYGGNDGMGSVVPRSGAAHASYAAARGPIALPIASLLPINPITPQSAELGFPAAMAEMQTLFQQQKLAVLSNVGPLVVPTTRAQFLAQSVPVPPNLFAHDEQQEQWQSLQSYSPNAQLTGWGGRSADLLRTLNGGSQVSLSISIAGANILQLGRNVVQYQMSPSPRGTFPLDGYQASGGDQVATALRAIFSQARGNVLDAAWNKKMSDAIATEQALAGALATLPTLTTAFPDTYFASQLKMVARMIGVSNLLGIKRQVFFTSLGGFDTHGNQNVDHPVLLRNLSKSLDAFYKATVELGAASQVTTFTSSDFGRTLANNEQGTDHAWGSNHFIMGGAVKGGDCYGTYPTVQLGGPDDSGDQGRWIPTTAVDQYAATLAKWFGVSATDIPLVVPNIGRFPTRDLGFLSA
jgi:uncharacterized protein (DUF1501 family)